MVQRICNNCASFYETIDLKKVKHYYCSKYNKIVRPSETCEYWSKQLMERQAIQTKDGVEATIRIWNPRSNRHEDVIA